MSYDFAPLVNNTFPAVSQRFAAINPATGETIGSVPECAGLVDEAVRGARVAQREWAQAPVFQRVSLIGKLAAVLEQHGEELAPFDKGFYVPPTVFCDVTREHTLFREEVFGPVLALIPWDDEAQMLQDINAVEYGLTASVWTSSLDTAMKFARRVESGTVWINGSSKHFPGFGFAGQKDSGLGQEETLEELVSFTQLKAVHYFGAEGRKNVEIL